MIENGTGSEFKLDYDFVRAPSWYHVCRGFRDHNTFLVKTAAAAAPGHSDTGAPDGLFKYIPCASVQEILATLDQVEQFFSVSSSSESDSGELPFSCFVDQEPFSNPHVLESYRGVGVILGHSLNFTSLVQKTVRVPGQLPSGSLRPWVADLVSWMADLCQAFETRFTNGACQAGDITPELVTVFSNGRLSILDLPSFMLDHDQGPSRDRDNQVQVEASCGSSDAAYAIGLCLALALLGRPFSGPDPRLSTIDNGDKVLHQETMEEIVAAISQLQRTAASTLAGATSSGGGTFVCIPRSSRRSRHVRVGQTTQEALTAFFQVSRSSPSPPEPSPDNRKRKAPESSCEVGESDNHDLISHETMINEESESDASDEVVQALSSLCSILPDLLAWEPEARPRLKDVQQLLVPLGSIVGASSQSSTPTQETPRSDFRKSFEMAPRLNGSTPCSIQLDWPEVLDEEEEVRQAPIYVRPLRKLSLVSTLDAILAGVESQDR